MNHEVTDFPNIQEFTEFVREETAGQGFVMVEALSMTSCTALHCTALHCTALHCISLHCTVNGILKGEDLTTEDMMSFYNCSDFAFNFNLIVKLKPETVTGDNIRAAVGGREFIS